MNTCKSYLNGRLPVPTGCEKYDDCFTCKFKDCIAPTSDKVVINYGRKDVLQENVPLYAKACELHDKGYRNIDIARELGKSDSLIYYWMKRYKRQKGEKARGAVRTV